jgi:hypothetical protein
MSLVGGFTAISDVGQRAGPSSRSFAGGCRGEGRRLQTSCTARTSSTSRRSMQPPDASLIFPCPLVAANDDEASLSVTLRKAHFEHFLAGIPQKAAKLLHCSERRVRARSGSGRPHSIISSACASNALGLRRVFGGKEPENGSPALFGCSSQSLPKLRSESLSLSSSSRSGRAK